MNNFGESNTPSPTGETGECGVYTVILATRNKGKIDELGRMLDQFGVKVRGLDEYPQIGEIEETGQTFEENAFIKARAVCEATGCVALADDSGLEVDALDGRPGVYSARYAGPNSTDDDKWRKLLDELDGVSEDKRGARFRCVMAACSPSGATLSAEGAWEGLIAIQAQGEGGFGYDPVFFDPAEGRTAAQMSKDDKNARSHRGKALRALMASWPAFMAQLACAENQQNTDAPAS